MFVSFSCPLFCSNLRSLLKLWNCRVSCKGSWPIVRPLYVQKKAQHEHICMSRTGSEHTAPWWQCHNGLYESFVCPNIIVLRHRYYTFLPLQRLVNFRKWCRQQQHVCKMQSRPSVSSPNKHPPRRHIINRYDSIEHTSVHNLPQSVS
jgi:hypothetical protein